MDDFYNNFNRKRQFPQATNNSKLLNKILSGNFDFEAEENKRRIEEI